MSGMGLEEALGRLLRAAAPLGVESVPVWEASGRVAAEDVAAPHPVPHFPRAAMDGYVCHSADLARATPDHPVVLRITGGVQMGAPPGAGPGRGEAWTITTGGPMPERGDRVLPLEAARSAADELSIDRPPAPRTHIVPAGEDIRSGARIVTPGDTVHPATAGALAACTITRLRVYRKPRVALVATGTELDEVAGHALRPGRVINSNSVTIAGELRAVGCSADYHGIVADRPLDLRRMLRTLSEGYDVVISTGGVSVGRHDAVHRTWLDLGAERIVGRVELKPGGPFFAGRIAETWAIGLSGTPVACLAAYHLLVLPLLRRLEGRRHAVRPQRIGVLASAFPRPTDRTRALWARVNDRDGDILSVDLLVGHPEGNVAALLPANGLVLIPPGTPPLAPGTRVTVLLLDHGEDRDRLTIGRPSRGPFAFGVIGASGHGKTTVATGLLRRLSTMGVRAVAVKHAAHGFTFDSPGSDSSRMAEAGASIVVLAGPHETAVRIAASLDDPDRLVRLVEDTAVRAWGSPPECILLEGFDHPSRPAILVGAQKPGVAAGEIIASVPEVADLSPARLDETLDGLTDLVRGRLREACPAAR
jgi:molybdopterin molybdotransferase